MSKKLKEVLAKYNRINNKKITQKELGELLKPEGSEGYQKNYIQRLMNKESMTLGEAQRIAKKLKINITDLI